MCKSDKQRREKVDISLSAEFMPCYQQLKVSRIHAILSRQMHQKPVISTPYDSEFKNMTHSRGRKVEDLQINRDTDIVTCVGDMQL